MPAQSKTKRPATLIPGDGIGPEISAASVEVLALVNRNLELGLDLETHEIGLSRLKTSGTTFPPAVLERCRAADGVLLARQEARDLHASIDGSSLPAAWREQDLFARVQRRLTTNQQQAMRSTKHEYLLRGLVSCGLCQLSCSGRQRQQRIQMETPRSFPVPSDNCSTSPPAWRSSRATAS